MNLQTLRQGYHRELCATILHVDEQGIPNFADKSSKTSTANAQALQSQLPYPTAQQQASGQRTGRQFEILTAAFIERAFMQLQHLRPGQWQFHVENTAISHFEQYTHLSDLKTIINANPELAAILGGDYIVMPDIVISRQPLADHAINQHQVLVDDAARTLPTLTPARARNRDESALILHATISCKWTIRSDRSQNTRTEALNLIRNRKGHTPHIVALTAEPDANRLASLALGTGDLDCTYHFALHELIEAAQQVNISQFELLQMMVDGNRLRDISDLPFDLIL